MVFLGNNIVYTDISENYKISFCDFINFSNIFYWDRCMPAMLFMYVFEPIIYAKENGKGVFWIMFRSIRSKS